MIPLLEHALKLLVFLIELLLFFLFFQRQDRHMATFPLGSFLFHDINQFLRVSFYVQIVMLLAEISQVEQPSNHCIESSIFVTDFQSSLKFHQGNLQLRCQHDKVGIGSVSVVLTHEKGSRMGLFWVTVTATCN